MSEVEEQVTWVSEYDYPNRSVNLTKTDYFHSHCVIRKDESLSDPGGDFDVYVSLDDFDPASSTLQSDPVIVKVVARLDGAGDLRNPHPDFDTSAIGSMTIWPYKLSPGGAAGFAHWVHWSYGDIFGDDGPRSWAEAMTDEETARRAARFRR